MIPLNDVSRKPAHVPVATITIILVNAVMFWMELSGGSRFVSRWALVPADVVAGRHWINILTAMFMHAGWLHILSNMLFLWVFGPAIEEAMGGARYTAFYLIGGVVASLAMVISGPASAVPEVGASGAIAAVMGAFLVTYPEDKIRSLVLLGPFITVTKIRAIVLVGLWFVLQVISARTMVTSVASVQGGVAYVAHVAGFLYGAIAARLFEGASRGSDTAPIASA